MLGLATLTYFLAVAGMLHAFGTICALHALLRTRSPQGAIAWSISLVLLPYLAVPLYLVFGRGRFRGYREIQSRLLKLDSPEATQLREDFAALVAPHRSELEEIEARPWERIFGRPFLSSNSVSLLVDGEATFAAIAAAIANAQDYILFQFYIIRDDNLGKSLLSALAQKAREGLRVSVLYDEIGSFDSLSESTLRELRDAGVRVEPFHSTSGFWNRFQLNFRNHRKIVVVDGTVGFIGGHNVGDEYIGRSKRFGHWHDLHLRIEGPETAALQKSFLEDWLWATHEVLALHWNVKKGTGSSSLLTVATGPADEVEQSSMMFLHAMNSSRTRIWITSPYFVPDDSILNALVLAAARGVDVRVLLPENPDHIVVWLASFAYLPKLLRSGARVFRYQNGFLHAKSFVVDTSLAMVGTHNLDTRSLRLNFEIATLIIDPERCSELASLLSADFEKSREETLFELQAAPLWLKLASRLSRLFSPIL